MRIPNVSERMKEAPAHALRAIFAGIGQALLVSDRMRRRLRGEHAPEPVPHAAKVPVTKPATAKQASEVPVARPAAEAAEAKPVTEAPAAEQAVPAAPAAPPAERAAPAATAPAATAPAAEKAAKPAMAKTPDAKAAAKAAAPKPAAKPAGPARPPIPDYEKLSIPSLRARLRGLNMAQVQRLLDYEKAHARRSDVITMYERRLQRLVDEARG